MTESLTDPKEFASVSVSFSVRPTPILTPTLFYTFASVKLFSIPNIITLLNLSCGCLAIVFAFQGELVTAAYLVGIAAVLDFLDGFVARALKQYSPIGKDLDSLADMVTFGVVPGVVMYQMIYWVGYTTMPGFLDSNLAFIPYVGFLMTLFSALRLAKFNNDTRQSDSFIGVPTPANSILVCSLPLILFQQVHKTSPYLESFDVHTPNNFLTEFWYDKIVIVFWVLPLVSLIMSYLLISEIPLFALKFKSFKWKGNELRYSFLAAAVIMLALLQYIALPLIIVLYILLSVINNLMKRKSNLDTSS